MHEFVKRSLQPCTLRIEPPLGGGRLAGRVVRGGAAEDEHKRHQHRCKREQSDRRSHPAPLPAGRCRAGSHVVRVRRCQPVPTASAESVGGFGTLAAFGTKLCVWGGRCVGNVIHLIPLVVGQSPVGIRLRSEANALSCGVAEELNLFSAWPSGTSRGGRFQAATGSWQTRSVPLSHVGTVAPPATPSGGHRQFLARV